VCSEENEETAYRFYLYLLEVAPLEVFASPPPGFLLSGFG